MNLAVVLVAGLMATGEPPVTPAPAQSPLWQALTALDDRIAGWKARLAREDGVLVEVHGSGTGAPMAQAMFISGPTWSRFEFQDANFGKVRSFEGESPPNEVRALAERSMRARDFDFHCRCFDANRMTVTLHQDGETRTLTAYGLDARARGPGAAALRAWLDTLEKLRSR